MKSIIYKVAFVVVVAGLGLYFKEALAPTLSAQSAIVQLNGSVDSSAAGKTLIALVRYLPVAAFLLSLLVFVPDVKKALRKSDSEGETISA